MKLTHALVGLVALGGAAMSSGAASAMPIGLATNTDIVSNIEQARIICGRWGRCWNAPGYYGAYGYAPRYDGGYGHGWHRGWRRW
jgi:hypothetical protein